MYNNILKEEAERILFQYFDDYKNILSFQPMSLDEYLNSIELDIEASESYDYYSIVINNHFRKNPLNFNDIEYNCNAYTKDFYNSVKSAFLKELQDLEMEYVSELTERESEYNYYKERHYKDDDRFLDDEPITEKERLSFMEENLSEINEFNQKIKTIRNSIY